MDRVREYPSITTLAPSPYCRELRSKNYFTLQSVPLTEADILDHSNHCWCRQTMQVVGPDGDLVIPSACGPDRACYRSHWDQE
ncbi:MAG: hypothetical protein ACLQVD_06605 [Capsulimonadaceae bacterium]